MDAFSGGPLLGQDVEAARQAMIQRMYQGMAHGYASLQPQVSMQSQPNAQASVLAPSMDTSTYQPRDQAQAFSAVDALQGPPPTLPDFSAVQPQAEASLPGPQQTLDAMRAHWHQNIQNDPQQAIRIYDELGNRGFSPEQVRQLLGAGQAAPELLSALQAQGTISIPNVQALPEGQMQQVLQHQNDIYAAHGVRGLSPQQGAGLDPWPTSFRDASVGYNDPEALLAKGKFMAGGGGSGAAGGGPRAMGQPQIDLMSKMYAAAVQSPSEQFVNKRAGAIGDGLSAGNMLQGLNNQVYMGTMTPEQAHAAYAQYATRYPDGAAVAAQFGLSPATMLPPRAAGGMPGAAGAGRVSGGYVGNPAQANMDMSNQPPMDVSGASQPGIVGTPPDLGPAPDQAAAAQQQAAPAAQAAPTKKPGLGGAPHDGPQPVATTDLGLVLIKNIDRMPLSAAQKSALKTELQTKSAEQLFTEMPALVDMAKNVKGKDKGKPKP